MKKTIFLCAALFIVSCGSDKGDQPVLDVRPEEAPHFSKSDLELSLSFGADEEMLESEFLIAVPVNLKVDNEGNIYVFDEMKVKVYDANGKPKGIAGGPGQGPGEFQRYKEYYYTAMYVSPLGYIAVDSPRRINNNYIVYSPDLRFLGNFHVDKYIPKGSSVVGVPQMIAFISDNEYIGMSGNVITTEEKETFHKQLIHYKDGDETVIVTYDEMKGVVVDGEMIPFSHGLFRWYMLDDLRIVYTHTYMDAVYSGADSYYTIHIYDPKTGERDEIEIPFTPEEILIEDYDAVLERTPEPLREMRDTRARLNSHNKRNVILKQIKYDPPIDRIRTDGVDILVNTEKWNVDPYSFYQVIDISQKKIVSSYNFDYGSSGTSIMKNGYIYSIGKNDDGFHVVNRYIFRVPK